LDSAPETWLVEIRKEGDGVNLRNSSRIPSVETPEQSNNLQRFLLGRVRPPNTPPAWGNSNRKTGSRLSTKLPTAMEPIPGPWPLRFDASPGIPQRCPLWRSRSCAQRPHRPQPTNPDGTRGDCQPGEPAVV